MNGTLEGVKLVIVDDDPGILRALSLILSNLKCNVTALANPKLVLEHLDQGAKPDLVVSDLRMPGLTGIELLLSMRFKGLDTPFILMSGHATPEEVASAKGAQLSAFLSKPFTPQDLVKEILRVLSATKNVANL